MTDDNQQPQEQPQAPESEQPQAEGEQSQAPESEQPDTEATQAEDEGTETAETTIEKLQEQLAHEKKEYLFLMADFDNFRKRTLQEKADLIKSAASRAMVDLLPVVDDFERAIDAMHNTDDIDSMKEGIQLIYNKFIKYLESQNVKPIESNGQPFDTDLHEAITMFPAPSPELKGRVVDTTLKGYRIGDKVIRHAKVVVGQ